MTEVQEMKMQLLDKFANIEKPETVEFCRNAYKFLIEDDMQEAWSSNIPQMTQSATTKNGTTEDGIYIMFDDNTHTLFEKAKAEMTSLDKEHVTGIGIKRGDWSLVVDLHDQAEDEAVTLTMKEDKTKYKGYIESYTDAISDWNGEANTEHLKEVGLNPNIVLQDGQWIPSLAEMLFILLNLKALNEALCFVDGEPLKLTWYWTSTEYSQAGAWFLNLGNGYINFGTKASYTFRVRAVSAFIN